MSFQDDVRDEVGAVFLNPDEFGETINLDGKPMRAVAEAFDVEFGPEARARPGVSLEGLTLRVRESDAPGEYRSGKEIRFNGERWYVLDADRDACLRTLRLYRELS